VAKEGKAEEKAARPKRPLTAYFVFTAERCVSPLLARRPQQPAATHIYIYRYRHR